MRFFAQQFLTDTVPLFVRTSLVILSCFSARNAHGAYMSSVKILVTSQKGGVGKSTVSANLSAYFADFKSKRVTLIDFDHQATASSWLRICGSSASIAVCDALGYKSAGMSVLKAKEALRLASASSDVVIADLTWVDVFPASLFFDYDFIVIPTSLSGIELASAMDFFTRFSSVFNSKNLQAPRVILMPNRLLDTNNHREFFNNCHFPVAFSLTSPVLFSKAAQESFGKTFFFKHTDRMLKNSFLTVCGEIEHLIAVLVANKEKRTQTLNGVTSIARSNNGGLLDRFVASRHAAKDKQEAVKSAAKAPGKWYAFLQR